MARAYPGDEVFVQVGEALAADYKAVGKDLDPACVVWAARTIWRHVEEGMALNDSIAKSRKEWRDALGWEKVRKHPELEIPEWGGNDRP